MRRLDSVTTTDAGPLPRAVTERHYIKRRSRNKKAAGALESTVSILLAALLSAAAIREAHSEDVVRSYRRAGVPGGKAQLRGGDPPRGCRRADRRSLLDTIGIAAAAGLIAYFLIAIGSHFHANDIRRAGTPLAFALIATATLILHLARPG